MMALMLVLVACGGNGGRDRGHDRDDDYEEDRDDEDRDEEDRDEEEKDDEDKEVAEEEADKPASENVVVNTPSELSDDLYSFQVSIDGTVYQFPMWAKEFKALGWTYDGDGSQTITSNQYTFSETWVKGDAKVYANFLNLTMNELTYDEAAIGGITFEEYYLEDTDVEIILPKGIQYGVSSRDDIIAAYGDPTDEYDGSLYYNMTYKYDTYSKIDLYVYKETGTLDKIELRNFVELEGKLYTLPCPVSVFIENGFKINEKNSQMEIAADSYGWIELSYNNQTYRCIVDNYANYATVVQNCFVTTMETSIYGPEFDLVIPGNIKVGDSESAVLEIIKKFNYETETSGDFTYYEVSNPEGSILAGYEITVKEGKVISLEVEYDD